MCDCCFQLCKVLLLILLFPFALIVMVFCILLFIILFPCYCIGKCCACCCGPECCLIICIDEHLVEKGICLPCKFCAWACEDCGKAIEDVAS